MYYVFMQNIIICCKCYRERESKMFPFSSPCRKASSIYLRRKRRYTGNYARVSLYINDCNAIEKYHITNTTPVFRIHLQHSLDICKLKKKVREESFGPFKHISFDNSGFIVLSWSNLVLMNIPLFWLLLGIFIKSSDMLPIPIIVE